MKSKKLFLLTGIFISILSISLMHSSCKDDNEGPKPPVDVPEKPNYGNTVKTAVHGFVTNEKDQPLADVTVTANDKVVTTDEYGYFDIPEADLVKDIAFVTAKKDGYFNGIRTWMATEKGQQLVRIKLLPKTIAGSFTASEGGEITTPKGVKLTFPKNSVVTSTGVAYSGKVNVAVQWLNPMDKDFGKTQPGNLTAVNAEGNLQVLISYGMVGAELTDDKGALLKVAPETDIKMTTPIPTDLMSIAPASMPLWAFNETKGVWEEEGVTTKTGNEYVGNVRHFSWWNCDYPQNMVRVSCRFINTKGKPVPGAKVTIKSLSNGFMGASYADIAGVFCRRVPKNSAYELAAYSPQSDECFLTGLSFSVAEDDIDLGALTVTEDQEVAVNGTVLECDGTNAEGVIYYTVNDDQYTLNKVDIVNGKYEFSLFACKEQTVTLEVRSTSTHKRTVTIPIADKTFTVSAFTNECREVIFSGKIYGCSDELGGRVTFVSKYRDVQSDFDNDKYKLSFRIPYTQDNESGVITVYNKKNEIEYTRYLTVKPGETSIKDIFRANPIVVSGTVNACDNKPLANGTIEYSSNNYSGSVDVINGVYSFTIERPISCEEETLNLIVSDHETLVKADGQVKVMPGNNTAGTITVCDGGGTVMVNHAIVELEGNKQVLKYSVWAYASSGSNIIEINATEYEPDYYQLHLAWDAPSLKIGTFDIYEVSYYNRRIGGGDDIEGKLTGKVTVSIANTMGKNILMKGTFVGKLTVYDKALGKNVIKDIKGSFYFNGISEKPS